MIETLGKMRGAVRVSVGIGTNQSDLDEFVEFCQSVMNRSVAEIVA
jgi:selenocysteine lyase/cysteine desulfurase